MPFKAQKFNHIAFIITGLVLLFAIYLATARLFNNYISIENDRAESFWSVVQLQKELDAMYYHAELYQANALSPDTLKLRYELLWSRFPVVQNMLKKDEILARIDGLAQDVEELFDHIKLMETPIIEHQNIEQQQLANWINTLATERKRLNSYIIHNLSGFDGDYVNKASKKLLGYLITIATLIIACILYLSFLIHILIQQQKHNRFLIDHDSLTGLKGRFFILKAISKRCQQEQDFTLINFDLNEFKQINDSYGHHTGDQVLLHIASLFKKALVPYGEVGRVGGDEFLWVSDIVDKARIDQVYARFLTHLQRPFITDSNKTIQLQVSAGAGFATDYAFNEDRLKDEVDKAMYCAKSAKMPGICWRDTLAETAPRSIKSKEPSHNPANPAKPYLHTCLT